MIDIKEIWSVIHTAFYEFGGPYVEYIGLSLIIIFLLALIVKFIIVPLKGK